MPGLRNSWVTVVNDEESCLKALVLAQSLRRVLTTADIVTLAAEDLPQHLKIVLSEIFDLMVEFPHLLKQHALSCPTTLDEAKIYSWKLTMYTKCIVLDPSIMVVKNCDELFDNLGDLSVFRDTQNQQGEWNNQVVILRPDYLDFIRLEEYLISSRASGENSSLWAVVKKALPHVGINVLEIDMIELAESNMLTTPAAVKLLNFGSTKPWATQKETNTQRNIFASEIWMEIFTTSVLPCISNAKNSPNDVISTLANQLNLNNCSPCGITKSRHVDIKDSIAIIGQSCRLPGANSVDEFWKLLESGGDGITSIPLERLKDHQTSDPRFTSIKAGFLKCAIEDFDAKFFGISPREAAFMDPQQRLMVEVAWEALEDAAINPLKLKGSNTGVFSGVWTHEYERLLTENTTGRDFHHVVLGNAFSATSARVSYFLGLNGPNVATESGCSSSMVALHLACDSLRKKETDLALATGVNLIIDHFPHSEVSILAKDGHCKTFDANADGFARAEGVVVVVLKRFADALRDGDKIISIVRGSGVSNEGTTSSFGTPSKFCQEIAIKDALRVAGVKPEEVDYVEAHGTGTPIGDPIEFAAISAGYKAQREKPLIVGSVKTNTGHTESAAGLAGVLKVNLAMKNELIPVHRNMTALNPNIDLNSLPAQIPLQSMIWSKNASRKRLAGISSFGISGTNVHVILEEPPTPSNIEIQRPVQDKTQHLLTLSAKTENALKDLVENYSIHLKNYPELKLKDICYTSNIGRQHLKYRLPILAKDLNDLKDKLFSPGGSDETLTIDKPKIAFLFTGQGSQYSSMAKTLYQTSPVFHNALDLCDTILKNNFKISIIDTLFGDEDTKKLDETLYSQTSIFCIEYGLLKLWESLGIKPEYVLGHSVGEFAASVAAQIMSLDEALILVARRSELIHNLPSGGMLAIRSNEETTKNLVQSFSLKNPGDWLDVAVINSSNEVVVAGKSATLCRFSEFCSQENIKSQPLAASHAFHSRDMDLMLSDFGKNAVSVQFKSPTCKYVSGSTGKHLYSGDMNSQYWQNHARYSVDFTKGINLLHNEGCNVFIEIGAHPILIALGMTNLPSFESTLWLPSIRRNEDNWTTFFGSVSKLYTNGFGLNWDGFHSLECAEKVQLPHYPFQRQTYWIENKSDALTKPLHPLLGRKIPLAVIKDHVFQNILSLNDFTYLLDHQVANVIVLPGAGFAEIILAAAKEVFKDESNHCNIVVEDFVIEAPMELEESKLHKIQVVVSELENSDSFIVKVFVYKNMNGYNDEKGWQQFSSGRISSNKERMTDVKLEDVQARCLEEFNSDEFYQKTSQVGIKFGNTFQSIKRFWKGPNEIIAEISCPTEAGNLKEYILHPIVLDAMIQTAGLGNSELCSDLYLPVGVTKMTLFDTSDSSILFARAFKDEISVTVHLFDVKSNLLCSMQGVRLVKTSIGSFMNVICAQKNLLPGLYQEVWRPRQSNSQLRVDLSLVPDLGQTESEIKVKMHEAMSSYDMVEQFNKITNNLVSLMIVKNFLKVGWKPKLGDVLSVRSFMNELLLIPTHEMLIHRFFDILAEDGYLKPNCNLEEGDWKVVKLPDEMYQISEQIKAAASVFDGLPIHEPERQIMFHCSDKMSNVLLGKMSGVELLFGNEDPDINPLIIFTKGKAVALANMRSSYYLESKFACTKTCGTILRILEIGGGSGATTNEILNGLHSKGIPFRYTFTDISPLFLEKAKTLFEDIFSIEYKVLNIENDPKYQGFIPNSYDVIIAANVIHATENIANSIRNVRQLLVRRGTLILQEMLQPIRYIDFIYGTMEGYWRFKDFDIRTNHPCINESAWRNVLLHNGFKNAHLISERKEFTSIIVAEATDSDHRYVSTNTLRPDIKSPVWIIFSGSSDNIPNSLKTMIQISGERVLMIACQSMIHENRIVDRLVNYSDEESVLSHLTDINGTYDVKGVIVLQGLDQGTQQQSFCQTSLYIAKYLASSNHPCKIVVVTRGVYSIGDQGNICPDQSTICGVFKSFQIERLDFCGELLDLDPDVKNEVLDAEHIFAELWSQNVSSVAYRNRKRHVLRCTKLQTANSPLDLPHGRFEIVIPQTKKINDVTYKSSKHRVINLDEVEICVKAAALNFRDIFTILKPDMYISKFEAVGTDFSGVISKLGDSVSHYKIGDEVFGISNRSSIASHVVVNSKLVVHKPKQFTFAEACTLPSVFLTAYYCLVSVANLKKGESILIHVASGGVGLVAIQIAMSMGVNIIATAGSKRKRAFLISLGLKHVFHSRDLSFGEDVKNVTNGKGVDMVLNSLTGHGFKETSLESCAINGRFVEMGKVNIWQPEDVKNLRPDVEYTIVNLEAVNDTETETLINAMKDIVGRAGVKPLPYTRFFASNIKDALNYFLKAQHIGKVVVTMPEIKEGLGKQFKSDLLFSGNGTYLVTGGLGGIGLEVSKWMVKCGARHVVLVGRTAPCEKTQQVLKMLSCKGVKVLSMQVDVGDLEQCKNLFAIMKAEMPPLRGVIHSAGALSDGMIRSQTWEKFEVVFNAKVRGGWNLHQITKDMVLEHFVMFSSLASLVGPLGQSNHCAANMFLDSLAFYRHSLGLPAQTINWGPWSEVGAATNTQFGKEGGLGLKPISPSQGISALQFIMSQPIIQIVVSHINFSEYIEAIPISHEYFSEVLYQDDGNNLTQLNAAGEKFWNDIESLNEQERAIFIKKSIESIVRQTLKLPESESVDEHQQFSEMGMDSLMAVEMRNKLQLIFGRNLILNPTSLLDYPTIAGLSNYLAKLTMSVDVKSQENITTETHAKVIRELSLLDSVIPIGIKSLGKPVRPSDIKSILLTGVTGHLGPHLLKLFTEKYNCIIHCLVRGKCPQVAEKRIKENMKKFDLIFPLTNVRIVLGDITQPNLGMTPEDYERLAINVDAVFHCAVKANHIEQYKKSKSCKDIRSVNVLGTIKILEFAGAFKTKRVAFMSSYSAANVLNEKGVVSDEFPSNENQGEGLVLGYPLTKFVCEKLMDQANRLGIPCTVFRLPFLSGHSETGQFTTDTNLIMNFIFTSARLKMFVDIPGGWYSIPVDIAAKISNIIFFNDQAETGLYNIVCNEPMTSNGYIGIADEMGISQKLVTEKEFRDELNSQNNSLLEMFKEATDGQRSVDSGINKLPVIKLALDGEGKHIFEISKKLYNAVSNIEDIIPSPLDSMRRQIKYAIRSGMLDQLGIEYQNN